MIHLYQFSIQILPLLKFLAGGIFAKLINSISAFTAVAWLLNHYQHLSIEMRYIIIASISISILVIIRIISISIIARFGWKS